MTGRRVSEVQLPDSQTNEILQIVRTHGACPISRYDANISNGIGDR